MPPNPPGGIAAFRRGDVDAGLEALAENYRFGMRALLAKMEEG
jgi:hypothetical protein